MSIHPSLYSSRTEDWATPQAFFDTLNQEFAFTLDACASPENAKVENFYTKEQDGLTQDWGTNVVFCNPPYGKQMRDWARKCFEASAGGGNSSTPRTLSDRYSLVPGLGLQKSTRDPIRSWAA